MYHLGICALQTLRPYNRPRRLGTVPPQKQNPGKGEFGVVDANGTPYGQRIRLGAVHP